MKKKQERALINKLKSYLKKSYKNIDIEIINAIISNILSDNSIDISNEEIFQVIKGLCYCYLSKYDKEYDVEIVSSKALESLNKYHSKNILGLIKDKKIYLEESIVLAIRDKNIEIIRTIMHEVHHAKQRNSLDKNVINYRNFLISIEQIIIMEMDEQYYHDNYQLFFDEIEARFEAEYALYAYLELVAPNILSYVYNDMVNNINECEKDLEIIMRMVKGNSYNRDVLIDNIISKNPQYIEIYPILNFYYNDDGTKIPVGEILLRDSSTLSISSIIKSIYKLDYKILKNRNGTITNLKKDLESLSNQELVIACISNPELNEIVNYLKNDLIFKINNSSYQRLNYDMHNEFIKKMHKFKEIFFTNNYPKKDLSLKLLLPFMQLKNVKDRKKE